MIVKQLSTALLGAIVSISFAPTASAQGVISFKGRIFGASCETASEPGVSMTLNHCPSASRNNLISAYDVSTADVGTAAPSAPEVKLVHDSGHDELYFDRKYVLLDKSGKRIESGAYLVTMVFQ